MLPWTPAIAMIGAVMIAAMAPYVDLVTAAAQEESTQERSLDSSPESMRGAEALVGWPDNEPVGMTPILELDGSSKDFGRAFFKGRAWQDKNRISIVSDPDSKYGRAIEKRFYVGDEGGWHGVTSVAHFGIFRELYFRQVFRVSANWQWHRSGGKYFYYGAAGRKPGTGPRQFILGWSGSGKTRWIDFGSGVGEYRPTEGPEITRDVYHTIEIHHVASTSGTNGSLRMWIDGVEISSFNLIGHARQKNVSLMNREWHAQRNLINKGLTGIEAFMFWGGQGDTKRVNDWIRLSELYISGKE